MMRSWPSSTFLLPSPCISDLIDYQVLALFLSQRVRALDLASIRRLQRRAREVWENESSALSMVREPRWPGGS